MANSPVRRLVVLGGCGALALALQVPAQADNPTFTTIATPSGRTSLLIQADRQITVSGTTSADVTEVNVLCLRGSGANVGFNTVAAGVPVTNGVFTAMGTLPLNGNIGPVCRLRAVPQGMNPATDDVAAFSGPILDMDTLKRLTQNTDTFNFDLMAGSADGEMEARSAGYCGTQALGTVPADLGDSFSVDTCVAGLGPSAAVGTTGSLRVDGHLALLPYSVLAYADASTSLTLTVHVASHGGVTWTESAPLVRCQDTDTYPPPSGQCDTVVPVGMTFTRGGTFDAGGHEIRLRDSFSSVDGKRHTVKAIYAMEWGAPPTGGLGFKFPGRSGGFRASSQGQVITGLPTKAATFLVRSDRFAVEGDPQADTRAVTWSRTPTRLAFSADDATVFGMSYKLTVPKDGAARLGFTDSESPLTSVATKLGTRAVAKMMPSPKIASPSDGAVIKGRKTVVKGTVTAGVNGLPVSVTVNGHPAAITSRSATKATYKVVVGESLGKHTLTAVATDAGDNTRSTSITVRNK